MIRRASTKSTLGLSLYDARAVLLECFQPECHHGLSPTDTGERSDAGSGNANDTIQLCT